MELRKKVYRSLSLEDQAVRPSKIASILWLRKFQKNGDGHHEISILVDNMQYHGIQVFSLADKGYFFSHLEADHVLNKRKGINIEIFGLLALPVAEVLNQTSSYGEVQRSNHYKKKQKFATLEDISKRVHKSVRQPNASIFRTEDRIWQDAVQLITKKTHVVVIDLSSLTENISWEIRQAVEQKGLGRVVFVVDEATYFNRDHLAAIESILAPIVDGREVYLFEYSKIGYATITAKGQSGQLARFILDVLDKTASPTNVPSVANLRQEPTDPRSDLAQRSSRRRRR